LLLSTHGVWAIHPDPHDYWRWTEEGLCNLVESQGFDVARVHRLGGSVLAGGLLAIYPLGGIAASGPRALQPLARLAISLCNTILEFFDRTLIRRLPRHYGSVGYLIVARKSLTDETIRHNCDQPAREERIES
jgi:hypothetical protein